VPSFHRSTSAWRDTFARVLLALTLAIAARATEPLHAATAAPGAGQASTLAAPLQAIRTAILASDAPQLRRCFETSQPVFVQVAPLDRGAFLGPGPLDVFLRRLLADRESVSFEVPAVAEPSSESSRAFVKSVWTYRTSASSTLQVDHVHLVLSRAPEHARWLIVEMKTSSR
jgi:hypothetical protein